MRENDPQAEPLNGSRSVKIGSISDIQGSDIKIAAGDIVTHIQNIHQRALSVAEEAAQSRQIELQLLAEGVSGYAQRLEARASDTTDALKSGPYKGLLEYRLGDAEIFFGRQQAIDETLTHLQRSNLTVLHSESGAGKTSLLQAGLAPRLIAQGILAVYLRPYDLNPCQAIKRAFLPDLDQAPGLAAASLREFLNQVCTILGQNSTLYIFLDQFEEFFTRLEAFEGDMFVQELAECLEDEGLNARFVLALRSEYFGRLASFRPRMRNPFANDYQLRGLSRAEAQEVMLRPVAMQGIQFEDGLAEEMLDDLGKGKIAPPQLQLVCAALYQELGPGDKLITRSLYEREGRAAGILRGHLERVLSRDLSREQRAAARRLLESLITSEQQRVIRNHTELVSELASMGVTSATLDVILDQLVDSRLLRVEETDSGLAYELAHDYLLDEIRLDPDVQARKAAQELLEQETRAYKRHRSLLSEDRLKVIEPYRSELRFTPEAESLYNQSQQAIQKEQQAREKRRNLLLASAIAVAVVMFILSLWGINSSRFAEEQLGKSEQLRTTATHALGDSERALAAAKAAEATAQAERNLAEVAQAEAENQRDQATRQKNIALARQLVTDSKAGLGQFPQRSLLLAIEAVYATYREGGERLPIAEEMLRQGLAVVGGVGVGNAYEEIYDLNLSADGRWFAIQYYDYTHLWDLTLAPPYTQPVRLPGEPADNGDIIFSPQGNWLLSMDEQAARLWYLDQAHPFDQPIVEQTLSGISTQLATFSQDEGWLALWDEHRTLLWDLTAQDTSATMVQLENKHSQDRIRFSPDDRWLLSESYYHADQALWDLQSVIDASQAFSHTLPGFTSFDFSPDGRWLVGKGQDSSLSLWDLNEPQPMEAPHELLEAQAGSSYTLLGFSPDSRWLDVYRLDKSEWMRWGLSAEEHDQFSALLEAPAVRSEQVEISPDHSWLSVVTPEGKIFLWEISGQGIEAVSLSTSSLRSEWIIYGTLFSPDSHWMIVYGDQRAMLVELKPNQLALKPLDLEQYSEVSLVYLTVPAMFSPDSRWLFIGCSGDSVCAYDLSYPDTTVGSQPIVLRGHESKIGAMIFSTDGHWLATGGSDATARLWDLTRLELPWSPLEISRGKSDFSTLSLSPDSRWLYFDGLLWDMASSAPDSSPGQYSLFPSGISIVNVFSPDNRWLAVSQGNSYCWSDSSGALYILDLEAQEQGGSPIASMWRQPKQIGCTDSLAFSPDGRWLAAISSPSRQVEIYDLAGQGATSSLIVEAAQELRFSADSQALILMPLEADSNLSVWRLPESGDAWQPSKGQMGYSGAPLNLSPDGLWLVTEQEGGYTLWELTGQPPDHLRSIPLDAQIAAARRQIAFSPDSRFLVLGGDETYYLWALADLASDPQAPPVVLNGATNLESEDAAAAFSPDGRWLVTSDMEIGSASLFGALSPSPHGSLPYISMSGIGKGIIPVGMGGGGGGGSGGLGLEVKIIYNINLWDMDTLGQESAPRRILLGGHESPIKSILFSPDQRWLVTYSLDALILWDLQMADLLAQPIRLLEYPGWLESLGFSPDGKWLIFANERGMNLVPLELPTLIDQACRAAGRNLMLSEWKNYFLGETYRKTCPGLPIHGSLTAQAIGEALQFANAGDLLTALERLQTALQQQPDLVIPTTTWEAVCESALQWDQYHLVEEACVEAGIQKNLLEAKLLIDEMEALIYSRDLANAKDRFEQAKALNPSLELSNYALNQLCTLAVQQDQFDQLEADCLGAGLSYTYLKANLIVDELFRQIAFGNSGFNLESVVDDLAEAHALYPQIEIRDQFGWVCKPAYLNGLFDRARAFCEDMGFDETNILIDVIQGDIKLKASAGDFQGALESIEQARSMDPTLEIFRQGIYDVCKAAADEAQYDQVQETCNQVGYSQDLIALISAILRFLEEDEPQTAISKLREIYRLDPAIILPPDLTSALCDAGAMEYCPSGKG